ncbi:hypothetical protein EV181_003605, partial [Coemansia sp. RSA 532]
MRYSLLFAISLLYVSTFAVDSDDDNNNDDAINNLLRVRPDLADDLMQSDISQSDCISNCSGVDQSCRARCLGVPGGASRKTPRKQDINGNLPLNWRKTDTSSGTQLFPYAAIVIG